MDFYVAKNRMQAPSARSDREKIRKKVGPKPVNVTAKFLENPFVGWTTIEEASEIIGRNKRTVWLWVNKGRISCFQVGKKIRVVNIEEVREFSEKHSPPRHSVVDKTQQK